MGLSLRPYVRKLQLRLARWSQLLVVQAACLATLAGVGYAAHAYAWPALVSHPYFRLRSVNIRCDSAAADPALLASRAGLYEGTSLWEVDTRQASDALSSEQWVKSARVARKFPDQVSLEVVRRQPIAATITPAGPYLIGDDGILYREENDLSYPDVPYLTGWQQGDEHGTAIATLRRALALVEAVEAREISVSQIDIDEEGTFWLFPSSPRVAVRCGEAVDAELLSSRLSSVLATLPPSAEQLEEIDLSYPDRAVIRVNEGGVAGVLAEMARATEQGRG